MGLKCISRMLENQMEKNVEMQWPALLLRAPYNIRVVM